MNTIKLPPVHQPGRRVRCDARFSGPLSECIRRNHPSDVADFSRRWHRAQMRVWAIHWREARVEAAMLGQPVEEVATLDLKCALVYRDALRRTAQPCFPAKP